MGCIIYSPHWLRIFSHIRNLEGILYICTNVGLSALLVSTTWAMREAMNRGTSDSLAPRFHMYIQEFNTNRQTWSHWHD